MRWIERLLEWFGPCPGAVIAFSGGVDSAVVARAAYDALRERALAVTADSPSLSRNELDGALMVAEGIGVPHRVVRTNEVADPNYRKNDAQRCFHCKSHLFQTLETLPEVTEKGWWILTGTNRDDLGDWRPGLAAAREYAVRSPLAELGIDKANVRQIAVYWNMNVADKPASPCLASRMAYGVQVTPERLAMVELAESELLALGFTNFRVRLHADELGRIEVPLEQIGRLLDPQLRLRLVTRMREMGFRFVSLDLEGFASGKMNRLIQIQTP